MSSRLLITKLVEEGKLTAELGTALLKQLDLSRGFVEVKPDKKVNNIRVKLEDTVNRQVLHEITVPLALVKLGLKMKRKVWADTLEMYPELKLFKVSFWDIYTRVERDRPGKAVDLVSKDGSRKLEIWLE